MIQFKRKEAESIMIENEEQIKIEVRVIEIFRNKVSIGVHAPKGWKAYRAEDGAS